MVDENCINLLAKELYEKIIDDGSTTPKEIRRSIMEWYSQKDRDFLKAMSVDVCLGSGKVTYRFDPE